MTNNKRQEKKSKSYLACYMFIFNFCQFPHARHSFATMIANMYLLLPAVNHQIIFFLPTNISFAN